MSTSQREKLTEIYFKSYRTIPSQFSLFIPVHSNGAKQIDMQSKQWQAKLNPNTTEPESILTCWEKDYDESYKEALQCLKSIQ